ncbi:MAG: hypothetical protein PUG48_02155 [Clostridia bacterium]|nr:hypothetical protein [Clostridia bacterium]
MSKSRKKILIILSVIIILSLFISSCIMSNINKINSMYIKNRFDNNQESFKTIVSYINEHNFKITDNIEIRNSDSDYSFKAGLQDLSKDLPDEIKEILYSLDISLITGSRESLTFYFNDIKKVRIKYRKNDIAPGAFGGTEKSWKSIKLCDCWYVFYESNEELPP